MLATIELNDQAFFKTHKIEHIAIEWMLPAELDASELATPQALPQTSFGVGCILSQLAPKLSVVDGTVSLAFHVFMLPHPHPDPSGAGFAQPARSSGAEHALRNPALTPLKGREACGR